MCAEIDRSDLKLLTVMHSPKLIIPPQASGAVSASGTITGTANQSWQGLSTGGPEVNVGFIVSLSGSGSFVPSSFTVNGAQCNVVVASS